MPRALLSVWDKTGLLEFAEGLRELGFELLSTGGTAKHLRDAGLPVTDVSDVTGFPEIMGGRVKTLHPHIHAALLADTSNPDHVASLQLHGIEPIALLAVNLYPFEKTVTGPHAFEEAVEMIDVGGPAMLRAAAKNHDSVTVVCRPEDYGDVLEELRATGDVSPELRRRLMRRVFATTATYDAAIAAYLTGTQDLPPGIAAHGAPDPLLFALPLHATLRYGENPNQLGAAYVAAGSGASVLRAQILNGKEISYNNMLDGDAAIGACLGFEKPAAAVVKHLTPCGAAAAGNAAEAIRLAIAADPQSAFGGVVAVNRPVGVAEAGVLLAKNQFLEVIIAPAFEPEALAMIQNRAGWGPNVRVLKLESAELIPGPEVRSVMGGVLWQTGQPFEEPALNVVSERRPTLAEEADLKFAWRIVRFVKSNAIVLARDQVTCGIGSGQTSRVGSAKIAIAQAGERARGATMASDGFFPFADSIEEAAAAGVTAIIEPGGSRKDDEVIAAANRLALSLVFTGVRQFRH